MKAVLEKIYSTHNSFNVKKVTGPNLEFPWHYHPEFEIVLIERSFGKLFMGDSVCDFNPGELVMMAPNMPHLWKNDEVFYQNNSAYTAECIVIHFSEKSLGDAFFDLPELFAIKQLLTNARRGIRVMGISKKKIATLVRAIYKSQGAERIILLLQLLAAIEKNNESELLSSEGFASSLSHTNMERINKIYAYVAKNFANNIELTQVALLVNMNESSFCRYFKTHVRKSFICFLNDIRIGYSCRLLLETDQSISQITFACGYNNLSYFNRQFKRVTGKSPRLYRFERGLIFS